MFSTLSRENFCLKSSNLKAEKLPLMPFCSADLAASRSIWSARDHTVSLGGKAEALKVEEADSTRGGRGGSMPARPVPRGEERMEGRDTGRDLSELDPRRSLMAERLGLGCDGRDHDGHDDDDDDDDEEED